MGITVGIDLGTTNSVTCVKKIDVAPVRSAEGEELTPSSVTALLNSDNVSFNYIVGRHSRDLLKQYPEQTITSVKRLMGRDFEDIEIQNIVKGNRIGYQITTDASEPGSIFIPLGGKMQTPEMISGIILSKLIHDGAAELQGTIDQAVVTVPAYFSDRQKFATRAACDYAGIKLLRLLPEPTAAALSFGLGELKAEESRTIMVFDLGGGTFDISVLTLSGGSFMEVTKGGDMWLGGDSIDQLIIDHVFAYVEKETKCSPIIKLVNELSAVDKARFLVEIKEKAEAVKIALSSKKSATIEMFGILKDETNQLIDIDVTITREEFTKIIKPVIEKVRKIAEQVLHEIRFEPDLIDTVLMVGGSSLVLAIQDELKSLFGAQKVLIHPRPMIAVAEGAALMAAKMASQENIDSDFCMMHSTSHDYYLQLADGQRHLLVARNTPLPVFVEEKLAFAHLEQSLARLRVFNDIDGVLETVGELWFHKEDAAKTSSNRLKPTELMLRFCVDEDNIITMKAWSMQNTQLCVETQIARGGLAAKLYNDLESTLSWIIAHSDSAMAEDNALRLSRNIVSTILLASDPITGETCIEYKQKAQNQINNLKAYQQKNMAPLSKYEFAVMAQKEAKSILSVEESLHFAKIIGELKQAIDNIDDVSKIESLEGALDQFYKETPFVADLARAENAASVIESDQPGDAKKIRTQARVLIDMKIKNNDNAEQAKEILRDLIYGNVSWSDTPSGRFDRDVCF